jgi:hypothetical protein
MPESSVVSVAHAICLGAPKPTIFVKGALEARKKEAGIRPVETWVLQDQRVFTPVELTAEGRDSTWAPRALPWVPTSLPSRQPIFVSVFETDTHRRTSAR